MVHVVIMEAKEGRRETSMHASPNLKRAENSAAFSADTAFLIEHLIRGEFSLIRHI